LHDADAGPRFVGRYDVDLVAHQPKLIAEIADAEDGGRTRLEH
jgi:hypothetical protein